MEYIPYTIAFLSFLLALTQFLINEKRIRKKERDERLKQLDIHNEKSAYPPRKDKHSKR